MRCHTNSFATRPWHKFVPGRKICATLSALTFCWLSFHAVAEDEPQEQQVGAGLRWFEIEVIVFKQSAQYHADEEYFPLQVRPVPLTRYYDLLSPLQSSSFAPIAASLLLPCEPQANEDQWLPVLNANQTRAESIRQRLERDPLCIEEGEQALVDSWYYPPVSQQYSGPREIAEAVIDGAGGNMRTTREPFLMPANNLELRSLRQRLEQQSDKTTLLHTSWRQPVFNRNQGRKIRLFGGENFTRDYDYLGFAHDHYLTPLEPVNDRDQIRSPDNTPLARIERLLGVIDRGGKPFSRPDSQALGLPEQPRQYPPNLPVDVWEFDGLMHIYLVGNFLHIDGDFNLRKEVEVPLQATSLEAQAQAALREEEALVPFLKAYHYNQLRRVISHETHYFDHPEFGIIVQIRRTDLSSRR
ncbi:MAG: hypothetical protein JJU03_09950 [Idiomarina sp.]|nr:hypothetical protein [Idiomarina sp.]